MCGAAQRRSRRLVWDLVRNAICRNRGRRAWARARSGRSTAWTAWTAWMEWTAWTAWGRRAAARAGSWAQPRPIGLSPLPFGPGDVRQGSGWPPRDILEPWPQRAAWTPWPDGAWTSYHHSITVMAEFAACQRAAARRPGTRCCEGRSLGWRQDDRRRERGPQFDHFNALLARRAEQENPGIDVTALSTVERGFDFRDRRAVRPGRFPSPHHGRGGRCRRATSCVFEGVLSFSAATHPAHGAAGGGGAAGRPVPGGVLQEHLPPRAAIDGLAPADAAGRPARASLLPQRPCDRGLDDRLALEQVMPRW